MREKLKLFRESLRLVWNSTPGWTFTNIVMSVLRSIFPLLLIWLLKVVVDDITRAATAVPLTPNINVLYPIIAAVIIWFLDEASSDFSNYVRKKQALNKHLNLRYICTASCTQRL